MGNIIDLVNEYPIFKEQKMKLPLQSIISIDDEHTDDRAFLVDMMDTWSTDEHNTFFNDMLCAINFILSSDPQEIAYTDINRIISLNYPGDKAVVPFDDDRFMRWYFIYCHECLHQLWDTFEVGDKIKQEGITYNHLLLNIASDTIINDYLSYIQKAHKKEPLLGWNPKVLKNEFGIDYDRKVDTQFTLYMKLLEVAKEKIEKAVEKYGGEIEPKEVRKSKKKTPPNDGDGGFPPQKHSDEYKKGYSDAIKDVLAKKVDPLTKKPLPNNNDYNKGYNDAIAKIKKGLEDGIEISDDPNASGGNGNNSDLPDIPWKKPKDQNKSNGDGSSNKNNNNNGDNNNNDNKDSSPNSSSKSASNSSDSAQDSANKAKQAASEAQNKADNASGAEKKKLQKEADKKKKLADKAQSEADKAKEAAKKAKEAEENGDEKGAEKAMKDAEKAADNAQNAAGEAMDKSASDYAKDAEDYAKEAEEAAKEAKENASENGSKSAKEAAKEAAEKAKHAKEMAKEAKEAANRGDKDAAKAAANSARSDKDVAKGLSDISNNANDDKKDNSDDGSSSDGDLQRGPGGTSGSKVDGEVIEHAKRLAEQAVQKARKDPDGKLKDFLDKCKSSYKLKQEGLAMNSMRGSGSWKKEVPLIARHFVKQKLRSRKQYRNTYNRIRRGERAFTDADLRNGRIIQQGREEVKNKIGFDISVFIDVSGSMENFLNDVCTSAYSMMDSLKRDFGAEKNVDVKKINLRTFMFDTQMAEKPYGTILKSTGGGTYDFDDLMVDVMKKGAAAFVNFIFTDGYFSNIPVDKLVKSFEKMEGLTILIVNNKDSKLTFDRLQKLCEKQAQSKFKVVYTETNFTK